jgi:hypothetical protein
MRALVLALVLLSGCSWWERQERIDTCLRDACHGLCLQCALCDKSPTRRADCDLCVEWCEADGGA